MGAYSGSCLITATRISLVTLLYLRVLFSSATNRPKNTCPLDSGAYPSPAQRVLALCSTQRHIPFRHPAVLAEALFCCVVLIARHTGVERHLFENSVACAS